MVDGEVGCGMGGAADVHAEACLVGQVAPGGSGEVDVAFAAEGATLIVQPKVRLVEWAGSRPRRIRRRCRRAARGAAGTGSLPLLLLLLLLLLLPLLPQRC